MIKAYTTKFNVGDQVNWNMSRLPDGYPNKFGTGLVVGIQITQTTHMHFINYAIEEINGSLAEDIPEWALEIHTPCGAV